LARLFSETPASLGGGRCRHELQRGHFLVFLRWMCASNSPRHLRGAALIAAGRGHHGSSLPFFLIITIWGERQHGRADLRSTIPAVRSTIIAADGTFATVTCRKNR